MISDKRLFVRHKSSQQIQLTVEQQEINANLIDYSFNGVSVMIMGKPKISKGTVLHFKSESPLIDTKGMVVWISDAFPGIKAGITKAETLRGRVSDYNFADLLLGFQRGSYTGILDISGGDMHRNVFFHKGDIIFTKSSKPEEKFRNWLLAKGVITKTQYKEVQDEIGRNHKPFAAILLDKGYMSGESLRNHAASYITEFILRLFEGDAGDVLFKPSVLPIDKSITTRLPASKLICEAVKSNKTSGLAMKLLPEMDSVLAFSRDPIDLFQELEISEFDRKVLSLVNGKRKLSEIMRAFPMDKPAAIGTICAFIGVRLIEVLGRVDIAPGKVTIEDIVDDRTKKMSESFLDDLDFLYDNHEFLGYYGVLGLKKESVTQGEIDRAYYLMSKVFHPDKHFRLPDETKEKLNTIFEYIRNAYKTLNDPALKKQYDNVALSSTTFKSKPVERDEMNAPPPAGKESVKKHNDEISEIFKESYGIYMKGREALDNDDGQLAEELFRQSISLSPDIGKYHYFLGLTLLRHGNIKDADKAIKSAIMLEPNKSEYHAELGHIYFHLGFMTSAKGSFGRALTLNPHNQRALEGIQLLKDS